MTHYDQILVCLDRLDNVAPIFNYVQGTARQFDSKAVFVVFMVAQPQLSEMPVRSVTEAESNLTPEQLHDLAREHMPQVNTEIIHADVVTGEPLIDILRLAHDRDVDLVVVERRLGNTGDSDEEALLAERITRKIHCSALILPNDFKINAANIIVPIRDSECSANALEVACEIAAKIPARIIALNVFHVGASGYTRVGTTFDEHHQLLREAADRESASLLEHVNTHGASVTVVADPDLRGKPAPVILEAVSRNHGDLVVIGARGRTDAAGVLLGNVTEQLIHNCSVPVLAVKKKGECLGVLRALLTLASEG